MILYTNSSIMKCIYTTICINKRKYENGCWNLQNMIHCILEGGTKWDYGWPLNENNIQLIVCMKHCSITATDGNNNTDENITKVLSNMRQNKYGQLSWY